MRIMCLASLLASVSHNNTPSLLPPSPPPPTLIYDFLFILFEEVAALMCHTQAELTLDLAFDCVNYHQCLVSLFFSCFIFFFPPCLDTLYGHFEIVVLFFCFLFYLCVITVASATFQIIKDIFSLIMTNSSASVPYYHLLFTQ